MARLFPFSPHDADLSTSPAGSDKPLASSLTCPSVRLCCCKAFNVYQTPIFGEERRGKERSHLARSRN